MIKAFRVWLRPLDYEHLVCVDGVENAHWLLDRLGESFIFRSAKPIKQDRDSTFCSFQVPSNSMLPYGRLQKLLAKIPEVTLLSIVAVK
jgi:hypothetical protein